MEYWSEETSEALDQLAQKAYELFGTISEGNRPGWADLSPETRQTWTEGTMRVVEAIYEATKVPKE